MFAVLRRLWNLLRPRPKMCPKCGDALRISGSAYVGHRAVLTEYCCHGCGHIFIKAN